MSARVPQGRSAGRRSDHARAERTRGHGLALALALAAGGGACTPSVARDPVPEEMDYDLQSKTPRAPTPTNLLIDPTTGHLSFLQAGILVSPTCSTSTTLSPAECEFDTYLQKLNGYPTVTPAAAPASAALDPATLTLGTNVVVLNAKTGLPVTDVTVGFDLTTNQLTVKPLRSWSVGASYWIGVRGYGNGVRAASGSEVVGAPTHALFKQDTSLTCGAASPTTIPTTCPGLQLLGQSLPLAEAEAALFQLEPVRMLYQASGAFAMMAAAGLPKEELAVLWGFPIHSASVPELDPTVGLVPKVTAPDEIRVAVQGPVDPATVAAIVIAKTAGSVLLLDLTAAAVGDLLSSPVTTTTYAVATGEIVIKSATPLVAGHQYGIFMTNAMKDTAGAPLVPSPVSVLLSLQSKLVDPATGHSAISTVSDSDAAMLEAGRAQLAALFNDSGFASLSSVSRDNLIYCFAFEAAP